MNLLCRSGGELAEDNSGILLEGHLERIARNVPSADHVRNQLTVTTSEQHYGFCNCAENIAYGGFWMRAHNREFV